LTIHHHYPNNLGRLFHRSLVPSFHRLLDEKQSFEHSPWT
jgi:hypothetical protein